MTLWIFFEVEYPTNSINKVNSNARANTAGKDFFKNLGKEILSLSNIQEQVTADK